MQRTCAWCLYSSGTLSCTCWASSFNTTRCVACAASLLFELQSVCDAPLYVQMPDRVFRCFTTVLLHLYAPNHHSSDLQKPQALIWPKLSSFHICLLAPPSSSNLFGAHAEASIPPCLAQPTQIGCCLGSLRPGGLE